MRTNFINLTFLLLLTFTLCSTSQYSNIINQFIELNNELGNPREDVGVIISNVKNVITDEEKQEASNFNELSQLCNSAETLVNGAITKLGNDITESTKNLNEWKGVLESSTVQVKRTEGNISETGRKVAEGQDRIERTLEDFKVLATETDQKLNVVKTLRDIITDELLNHNGAHSFVQLNKFTDKLNELKTMLNSESDSLYSPLVSVLITLASEQNFSDQAVLKKILENINNLENNLKQFRAAKEESLNNELKNMRASNVNLGRIKNAYNNMRTQSLSRQIDAQHYIHFYTNEINHFNAEKNRKNDELELVRKICNFERSAHNAANHDLQEFKAKVVPLIVEQIQKLQQ
jgi:hypothetical protein